MQNKVNDSTKQKLNTTRATSLARKNETPTNMRPIAKKMIKLSESCMAKGMPYVEFLKEFGKRFDLSAIDSMWLLARLAVIMAGPDDPKRIKKLSKVDAEKVVRMTGKMDSEILISNCISQLKNQHGMAKRALIALLKEDESNKGKLPMVCFCPMPRKTE